MCAVAAKLSDDEIEALADAYSGLPFVPAKQEFDAALAKSGKAIHDRLCEQCHSEGGANVEDEASIIAGQQAGYLKASFANYFSGERVQDKKMKDKMDELSEDDVKALIHYYASQQ